jgi:hypothetical protein
MMEVTVAAEVGEGILQSREEGVDQQVEDVEEEAEATAMLGGGKEEEE